MNGMSMMRLITQRIWLHGAAALALTACAALPPGGGTREEGAPAPVISRSEASPAPAAPRQTMPSSPNTQTPAETSPPVFAPPPDGTPPATVAPRPPAVIALLDSAGRQEQNGQLENAAATLERAVRVDPRNAMVWYRLARVRLAQGQWQAAANLAAKSNSLAGAEVELQRRNWLLIAEARTRLGDSAGARAARARAAEQ